MDLKLLREFVSLKESVYEGSAEQPIDSDITLPDYCPDILRILKCQLIPRIGGYQTTGDRITVDGSAIIRLFYSGEKDGAIFSHEHVIPFSKNVDVKNLPDNTSVKIRTKLEYVNCRAVSPRRVDIHGAISLKTKIIAGKKEELVTGAEGGQIQLRKQNIMVSSTVGDIEKQFSISEMLEIGSSKPQIQNIIQNSGTAVLQDYKIITNKLLVKGELIIRTLYAADTDGTSLESVQHSLPISQIIDMDGLTENCVCNISLRVQALDVHPKTDSYGESRLLDVNARLNANVMAVKSVEIPVIADAYSLKNELILQVKPITFERLVDVIGDIALIRKSIDEIGGGISSIIDVWNSDTTAKADIDGKEIVISGDVSVNILGLNTDGIPTYFERKLDYEYRRDLGVYINRLNCEPNASVVSSDYNLSGSDKLDIRIELKIEAGIFASYSGNYISDIELDEKKEKNTQSSALTIYFADKGENVWDIARKYNTTSQAIVEENDLKTEAIEDNSMILIPGV